MKLSNLVLLIGVFATLLTGCDSAPQPVMNATPAPPSPSTPLPTATQLAYPLPPPPTATALTPASTPRPTFPPTATHTPTPTRTPTPSPTATGIPTIIPPIQTVSAGHPPTFPSDMLFIRRGNLMLLDRRTSTIQTLDYLGSGQVEASTYSVRADGKKVALLHYGREIALLDVLTRTITRLETIGTADLTNMSRAFGVQISLDGQWIGYILRDTLPTTGRVMGMALPFMGSLPPHGVIFAIRTDAPDRRIELGYCAIELSEQNQYRECNGFLWAPDSRHIVWTDARGVWVNELGMKAHQLAASAITKGGSQGLWQQLLAWSPRGRYVLGRVQHIESTSFVVLDADTGRAGDLPTAPTFGFPDAAITWLRDGRLLVLRPADGYATKQPFAEVWRINDTGTPLLTREISVTLNVDTKVLPMAPAEMDDGRIALALINSSATNYLERGLFALDIRDGSLRRLTGLPPARGAMDELELDWRVAVSWSPGRTSALVTGLEAAPILCVPADGSPLYDVTTLIEGSDFTWLP